MNASPKRNCRAHITLVLGDHCPIVLEGLEHVFRNEKPFEILARCLSCEETLSAVQKLRPDILVFDIHMPSENGFEVLSAIKNRNLPTRTVIFTTTLTADEALKAIRLGAAGIVLKDMSPKLLIECVRKVQAGEKWLDGDSSVKALDKITEQQTAMQFVHEALSSRQMQIIRMVAGGLRNKEIGKKLFISEGTVEVHLHKVYRRLDMKSRLSLALYARERGLCDPIQ
jgi:DNA-binding NarL/FixJ family response regulator